MARKNYQVGVDGSARFKYMKDARRCVRLFEFYMHALGYGDSPHYEYNRSMYGDVFRDSLYPKEHTVTLNLGQTDCTKEWATRIGEGTVNVMKTVLEALGVQSDEVYLEIERMMDTRIDCRTVAA